MSITKLKNQIKQAECEAKKAEREMKKLMRKL